ncbi:MAG: CinA family protein [Pseudomonadota bacterium]
MQAARILEGALAKELKITVAESCTGGLLASALTEVPGSSAIFERGFVTYSNQAKEEMLGVRSETLAAFGAVSQEVAAEMAQGARLSAGADLAVSVTGIAGPGGSDFKPEGRVCFALSTPSKLVSFTVEFGARGRHFVRQASVYKALSLIQDGIDTWA